jgi:hypothetical protein
MLMIEVMLLSRLFKKKYFTKCIWYINSLAILHCTFGQTEKVSYNRFMKTAPEPGSYNKSLFRNFQIPT